MILKENHSSLYLLSHLLHSCRPTYTRYAFELELALVVGPEDARLLHMLLRCPGPPPSIRPSSFLPPLLWRRGLAHRQLSRRAAQLLRPRKWRSRKWGAPLCGRSSPACVRRWKAQALDHSPPRSLLHRRRGGGDRGRPRRSLLYDLTSSGGGEGERRETTHKDRPTELVPL